MKVISLWQPWASLIVHGLKAIETRDYPTHVRGRIAIHATKTFPAGDIFHALYSSELLCHGVEVLTGSKPNGNSWNECFAAVKDLPCGCILGTVEVYGCLPSEALIGGGVVREDSDEFAFGNYSAGRYGWLLRDPVLFEHPIPAKGKQGWWEWTQS